MLYFWEVGKWGVGYVPLGSCDFCLYFFIFLWAEHSLQLGHVLSNSCSSVLQQCILTHCWASIVSRAPWRHTLILVILCITQHRTGTQRIFLSETEWPYLSSCSLPPPVSLPCYSLSWSPPFLSHSWTTILYCDFYCIGAGPVSLVPKISDGRSLFPKLLAQTQGRVMHK